MFFLDTFFLDSFPEDPHPRLHDALGGNGAQLPWRGCGGTGVRGEASGDEEGPSGCPEEDSGRTNKHL